MAIRFEGRTIELLPGESVLEAIERQGSSVPAFCRRGVCQTCLVKAKAGAIPSPAQKGLKDGQRRQGLFLACVCKPIEDLEIERYGSSDAFPSRVERVERLSAGVLRVFLTAPVGFVYQAGQFLQVERTSDGLMRPYSIASLPGGSIELHVALLPGGAMSSWLLSALGEPLILRGPFGECSYIPEEPERPLCLAGTGTGLSPLLGVVRAARAAGHRAPIRLYHGSPRVEGLYLWAELQALLEQMPALRVVGSVLEAPNPSLEPSHDGRCQVRATPLDEALLADGGAWADQRVYLCGDHDLIRKLQRKLYLAGVPLARIHADPFVAPPARA